MVGPPQGQGVTEVVAKSDRRLVSQHTVEKLPWTQVLDGQGKLQVELPSVAQTPPFSLNIAFNPLHDANGGLLYHTAVVKPHDFDPQVRYPVVLDVYGGPHHLQVVHSQRNWLIDQWVADQGFLVVSVDNHGTPGRGVAWETGIFGKFGEVPLDDQIRGLQELAKVVPQMDLDRVGVAGWSFGGFMSALAVLKRPDVFKAAVAGAPVTDWEDYDSHCTERYMGTLPQSESNYKASSLLGLKGGGRPLLLVHGTADDNVYFRNSLRLADSLFRAGQPFEFLPLTGITHSYSADPTATERLWLESAAFFRRHLGSKREAR
jgi:dipeptidyl-peptidase-4